MQDFIGLLVGFLGFCGENSESEVWGLGGHISRNGSRKMDAFFMALTLLLRPQRPQTQSPLVDLGFRVQG